MKKHILLALGLVGGLSLQAQLLTDAEAIERLRTDVYTLAHDSLEGREAGMAGEKKAARYIMARMKEVGLQPKGDSSFVQAFTFQAPPVLAEGARLQLGRTMLKPGTDFYPLSFTGSTQVRGKVLRCGYGMDAPELGEDDYAGKDVQGRCVAISIGSPDGIHPHSKFLAWHDLRKRAQRAAEKGAAAVIFYREDGKVEPPSDHLSAKDEPLGIPVVYYTGEQQVVLLQDGNPCAVAIDIVRRELTAWNVAGYLDNKAERTVVIGAHYDHLGWGEEGSTHRGERAIHNGADDNASGVAVMLQLAADLRQMDLARSNNYLFIAFSGEEKGLFGSKYWTRHATVPLDRVAYMLNMDMVGRLDSLGNISINGVGTSPAWSLVPQVKAGGLTVKTTESGVGPSDHTSFYRAEVPAIHFFTGAHKDYHKPGDDADKVNYAGMLRVVRYMEELITGLDGQGRLTFTRATESDSTSTPRFKVTMGIVPDYMYSGKGVLVEGVTEGKPASKAGIKAGDIVVRMGSHEVVDMMGYMKALGQFSKGETVPVQVLREGKEVKLDVTF
ncbi:MAG: M28 family peptidase [Flavobacteriales bacterium]|nr:M28 family peptidase [Flavobacteriales bacterium]